MNEFEQCISDWADRCREKEAENAALRAKVEALEQELYEKQDVRLLEQLRLANIDNANTTAELAAMTQERDRLREAVGNLSCEVCKMEAHNAREIPSPLSSGRRHV